MAIDQLYYQSNGLPEVSMSLPKVKQSFRGTICSTKHWLQACQSCHIRGVSIAKSDSKGPLLVVTPAHDATYAHICGNSARLQGLACMDVM